jgi:hypothetical protein
MGAPTIEQDLSRQEEVQPFGFVEYVLWKMREERLRYCDLAKMSGLSRSRTHYVFHRERAKRRPGYIHEYNAVAAAFQLSPIEAQIANDLYAGSGTIDEATDKQIKFFSGVIKSFQKEMHSMMERISALEWNDVREAHGDLIVERVMADVEKAYVAMADRKELRLRDLNPYAHTHDSI